MTIHAECERAARSWQSLADERGKRIAELERCRVDLTQKFEGLARRLENLERKMRRGVV